MESASGFTNSTYGQNTRLLNQAINRLRECGSEAILGEMPKIAVIGNQSAGKSSLIEAMSGIRVPRQVGTCTRCPLEVVLSHSEERWTCQISLRLMFDINEYPLPAPEVIPFGDMMYGPEQVEDRLRRAQEAILRWYTAEIDPATLLTDDHVVSEMVGFSRNVVRLDVSGPDLVDVTFIDLPGIISNANQKWVDTVNKLVSDYISQPDCLILVTINMADDIENQGAASLARTYDRAGKRTIGVLTKADMVTDEERFRRWSSIISGQDLEHRLTHGYFLTMQRRPNLTSTWQDNLIGESQYFRTDPFWTQLGEKFRGCIGTVELRKKLSLELSKLIKTRIPALVQEVQQCIRATNNQKRALPSPITEVPQHFLLKLCSDFIAHLNDHIKGENDRKDLALMIAEADRRFLDSVRGAVAQFGLADHDEKQRGVLPKSANDFLFQKQPLLTEKPIPRLPVNIGPDDDDVVDVTPTSKRNLPQTPQRTRAPSVSVFQPMFSIPHTPPPSDDQGIVYTGEFIELEEVRGMIRREKARKLPGAASSVLQERLIRRAIANWEQCTQNYVSEVHDHVAETLNKLNHAYFSRFTESGLFNAVWEIMQESLKDLSNKTRHTVHEQIRMESRPFTQNAAHLSMTATTLLKKMTEYRRSERNQSAGDLLSSGFQPPDDYDSELQLIAHVLAYINVAYKRFADMIPMRTEEQFQTPLADMIQKQMMDKFLVGEGCEERCRAYLEDAPELITRRRELDRKLDILRAADQEVRKFQAC